MLSGINCKTYRWQQEINEKILKINEFYSYIKHRFIFVAFCLSAFTLDQMYFVFVKLKETNQQNIDVLIVTGHKHWTM